MANAIEIWPVERLKPYANNARTHSEAQIEKIAASILEFGFTNPILVDENDGIIAGHGRLMAAMKLKMADVPIILLTHMSDAQRRAYILADNRLALDAGWDDAMLARELAALQADGFDLELTGFNDDEIDALLAEGDDGDAGGETDEDAVPEAPYFPTSVPGDVWILGQHRVMCGDSTNIEAAERLMDGLAADCMWTDPPYNVAYEGAAGKIQNDDMEDGEFRQFLVDAFTTAFAVMRAGAPAYIAHADTEGLNFRAAFQASGFKLSSCLIWRKNSLVLGRSDYQWQHEPILYGWKEGAAHIWFGERNKTTILEMDDSPFTQVGDNEWQITLGETTMIVRGENLTVEPVRGTVFFEEKPARNGEHPTMKPVALIERMLENSTKRGAVVLDLFGSSGSTLIAAHKLGRRARLMELDPKFVDVIVRRWQDFTGKKAVHEDDGITFDEMAEARKPVDA
jgi:DNA modification methylase